MKPSKKLGLLVAGVTLALASTAASVQLWTGYGTITEIYAGYTDKGFTVYGLNNPQGCANVGIRFLPTDSDSEGIRNLLTAALLSGKKVRCLTNGCVTYQGQSIQKGEACHLNSNQP